MKFEEQDRNAADFAPPRGTKAIPRRKNCSCGINERYNGYTRP
jgi:hypothetical protein